MAVLPVNIDAEHEPALSAEPRVAESVSLSGLRLEVAATISFERDLERRPRKVEGVVADPMLLVTSEDVTKARGRMDALL
jgi:hypothetical protein